MAALLEMTDISKSFPGVLALDSVSISVEGGTVHALMGENGAGKSTLMKCLFGVYEKDTGKILFNGEEVNFKNSKDALIGGVAMVHQELNQALDLSIAENIWLGRFPKNHKLLPFISEKKMIEKTLEIFRELDISENPALKVKKLSVSRRQMVEIAKAVSYGSKLIVFDEPTSSLSDTEAEKLFEIIAKLKARGCAIIYISHKMEEILRISDKVSVMRDGKLIATRDAKNITTDEIIKLMVGRELKERYPEKQAKPGDILLTVDMLSGIDIPKNASFNLRRGEILGIAGLEGSG
ncbi:MAG: sugar ABC transporter ATP-binding protein, partial [Clostridia bacterium]|nr:sugar ABC transporter ATP-binding protein [Clostridia bacterium]